MKLREIVENIKKSELFKLRDPQTGEVKGYRMKLFNVNTQSFEFYDFSATLIEPSITNRKDIGYIDVKLVNGVWYSDAEIKGSISIQGIGVKEQAVYYLSQLEPVYSYRDAIAQSQQC